MDWDNLPDDPEGIFLEIEQEFLEELEDTTREETSGSGISDYMTKVRAAAAQLGIPLQLPPVPQSPHSVEAWQKFRSTVLAWKTAARIRRAQRRKSYSVAFDAVTKQRLHAQVKVIREIVDRLNVSALKKERLYDRINDLAVEIDKDRTPFEVAMALIVTAAETGGKAYQKLKPAIEGVTKLIAAAHDNEGNKTQLKLPAPLKALPPPDAIDGSTESSIAESNDDLPF